MAKRNNAYKKSAGKRLTAEKPSLKESADDFSARNVTHKEISSFSELEKNSFQNDLNFVEKLSFNNEPLTQKSSTNVVTSKVSHNFIKARRVLDHDKKSVRPSPRSSSDSHPSTQSSSKRTNQEMDADTTTINYLHSVFDAVRNLKLCPSVLIYTLSLEEGLSAVDIDQKNSHIACSPVHSHAIHLVPLTENFVDCSGSIYDAWSRYKATKSLDDEFETRRISGNSSSAEAYHHDAEVTSLQFTPDDNFLLSGSLDGVVKAFSTSNNCTVNIYKNVGCIFDIAVSTDSVHFATACTSHYIASLYHLEKRTPLMTFQGHTDAVKCVSFHSNGLYIATASCDNTIKLWSTRDSRIVRNFVGNDGDPGKLAFSPDGKYLTSTNSGTLKIWDLASGKLLHCLQVSDGKPEILNICYDKSGDTLVVGGSDEKILLWSIKKGSRSDSSALELELLKCEKIDKRIHSFKYTSGFFSCMTA